MNTPDALGRYVVTYHGLTYQLKAQKLELIDVYVYSFLKTFMDKKTKSVKMSVAYFSSIAQVSENTARQSLARLKSSNYITYKTVRNVSTTYTFIEYKDHFEQIPYLLVRCFDLTPIEKSYMICFFTYCLHDKYSNPLEPCTYYTPTTIARELQLPKTTTIRYSNALIKKGYIEEVHAVEGKNKVKAWVINMHLLVSRADTIIAQYEETIASLKEEVAASKGRKIIRKQTNNNETN